METQNHENIFTFVLDNGDVIRDVIRTENVDNNSKTETVDRYINEILVSITTTNFVNGYKHGLQTVHKVVPNLTLRNYYNNGEITNP